MGYRRRNIIKRRAILSFVLLFSMALLIGYAYLNKKLVIRGDTTVAKNIWRVEFQNIEVLENNAKVEIAPYIYDNGSKVNFVINLEKPGDSYTFTVDVVNSGNIDAMLNTISLMDDLATKTNYLDYSLSYIDGIAFSQKDLLSAGSTDTIRFTVTFKKDITSSDLENEDTSLNLTLQQTYVQADETANERRYASFATDSWSTIVENVSIGNGEVYAPKKGEEVLREVTLTGFEGTHYLRIANTTDCTNGETSETACGFVVEFADIITTHVMNSDRSGSTIGTGNNGGWKNSEMRNYVNNDIYNALPDEIKNSIISTKVISSHGNASGDDQNLESEDYLYLLSTKEVWGKAGTSNVITYDSTDNTTPPTTRPLDYYSINGVTTSNYSGAIKKRNNNTSAYNWWLRSASSNYVYTFFYTDLNGRWYDGGCSSTLGVSPAFRIGD